MRYHKFPVIKTIDDVLPAVKDREEFVVAERDWGTVIDYQITLPDSFPCPVRESHDSKSQYNAMVRRECRGLKFGPDGKILARPYHKFFNLGERPETTDKELSERGLFHEHFRIMPKLDGSMIHPIIRADTVLFCTRMGVTDVASQAHIFAKNLTGDIKPWYLDFCYDMQQRGITPIFEWCSRQQRIVLDYPQDQLVLTAIRLNETGEYLTRAKMMVLSEPYNIPMVELFEGDWDGIERFAAMVRDIENAEGFVFRWDDGNMVKMKGEWYTTIHRAKDSIAHEKRIIGMLLNDDLDDVLPHLLEHDYERLLAYRDDFWTTVKEVADTLDSVVGSARSFTDATGMDAKSAKAMFAKNTVANYKGALEPWKGMLFNVWDGQNSHDVVIAFLRRKFSLDVAGSKAQGSQSVVDMLRAAHILGKKSWLDYGLAV